MIRAIAQQAEAERARRAKVINAEGEKQAATMLAEAANMLAKEESALTLRYLQTLKEIANEKSNTIVFPVDLIEKIGVSAKALSGERTPG
jgi:regulator of protease activity HflC (stomatin/prohibitin superfamily)